MGNNWILIVREKYGKTQHSKAMGFSHTSCVALTQTIPRIWEKSNRTVRKKYGKTWTFESYGFWNFLLEVEIHAVPSTWEKWISIIREKYGKTQTFLIYGFLKNFGWSRNPYTSQNMGKVNSHNTRKLWKKNKTFQSFSNILREAEIYTIPKIWEKWIPIIREKYEKTQTFQSYVFLKLFAWCRNPCISQKMGNMGFPYTGKVWEKTNISK